MNAFPRVVIAGGGTGGHVIPAIALAEEIVRRGGTARFVGTRGRLEERLVPEAGFDIDYIEVKPLVAGGIAGTLRGLAFVPLALFHSTRLLRKLGPDAVIGVGGYVAGPVVMGARLSGIPAALLEQNATVGLTNRLLSRFVTRAFVAYEETAKAFGGGIAELTGNPVRRPILDAAEKRRAAAPATSARRKVRVLVMGGSQGASAIDDRVPRAVARSGLAKRVTVVHQCCHGQEPAVRKMYADAGITAEVVPFIDDTAAAYGACDLVIARAGATTVSELTVMGLPAILIPYPHHKDHQQALNAEPMRRAGAAVVLDEETAGEETLSSVIAAFVRDGKKRREAAEASYRLGRRDAAERIADGLEALARRR
jgi:UDP-N-acetylglucosamine--N-acetylmuramyl-(pentapeptide) pyrophosphoryl-undecaprenol N-acetylglucosamine transferase